MQASQESATTSYAINSNTHYLLSISVLVIGFLGHIPAAFAVCSVDTSVGVQASGGSTCFATLNNYAGGIAGRNRVLEAQGLGTVLNITEGLVAVTGSTIIGGAPLWAESRATVNVAGNLIVDNGNTGSSTAGVAALGGVVNLGPSTTIIHRGNSTGGGGLYADFFDMMPATITATGSVTITTLGAPGVLSAGGSLVKLQDIDITVGNNGNPNNNGIYATGVGSRVSYAGGILNTSGTALRAISGGTIVSTGDTSATTTGSTAFGILADGTGSTVTISGQFNGDTVGAGSHGAVASTAGNIALNGGAINTAGTNAYGIFAQSGGDIYASSLAVTTGGNNAVGVRASGSNVTIDGSTIQTTGELEGTGSSPVTGTGSVGVHATDSGTVLVSNSVIKTAGRLSHAVQVDRGGTLTVTGSSLSTGGTSGYGVRAQGSGSTAIITDTTIQATNNNSRGVIVSGEAHVMANQVEIKTAGVTTYGINVQSAGSLADLTNVSINTVGTGAYGLFANQGSTVKASNLVIETSGGSGHGAFLNTANTTNADHLSVKTSGNTAYGLSVQGADTVLSATNVNVLTSGTGSHAVIVINEGLLDLRGGELTASGINANALQTVGPSGTTSTAILEEVKLATLQGISLKIDTAGADILLKNSQAVVNNGLWLDVTNGASVDVDLDGSTVRGAAVTAIGSTSDVSLSTTSFWNIAGDSNLTSLVNDGIIEFDGASPYKTLTVGSLVMNGGTFVLNTHLDADTSPTDIIVVTGNTSGPGNLKVLNAGGPGALTVADGIKVVEVGGASDGVFTLLGDYVHEGAQAVVGGAYAYKLYQNGISDPNDGNWYLRSVLKDNPVDPVDPVDPTDPVEPVDPIVDPVTPPEPPLYQAGVPVYEVYPQLLLGLNGLPTLLQRAGNRHWNNSGNRILTEGADAIGTPYAAPEEAGSVIEQNGVWGRIEGAHNRVDPRFSTTKAQYDFNSYKIQAGLDGMLAESEAGKLIGGLTVHYVRGSADIRSAYDAQNGGGEIRTDGYGFGGTLTWYGESGLYVDTQAQATWYDSDLSFDGGNATLTNGNHGFGYALSMESGKRIALDPAWSLTPQAQLVWSSVDFDNFSDVFSADVTLDRGRSLQGRFGLALDHQTSWYNAKGLIDRAQFYGVANLYYEFLEGTKVRVADTSFANRNERLWGGIGLGGSYNWNNDKHSVFGEVALNTALESFADSYSVNGTVGYRIRW